MTGSQYTGQAAPDYPYDHGDYAGAAASLEPSRVTQLVNWAGALVSMGLVIGMAVWAWQLMMRDVTEVPVIQALEGPMRIAPTDPGGSVAENQGLAVNRLAEGEEAAPVPDQLVLAPAPTDLSVVAPVSRPAEEVEPADVMDFANASVAKGLPEIAAPAPDAPARVTPEDTAALIERLLAEAQETDVPEDIDLPNMADAPDDSAPDLVARASTIPISVPGVRRSPRPTSRPAGLSSARTPVADLAANADAPAGVAPLDGVDDPLEAVVTEEAGGFEIAAADLETGTRLVQLGAFDSPELARAEWARLSQLYPDFFLGRARVVEQASSGGQTFYRLRGHGFGDLSASRRFCAALVAQGAGCIPVTVR